MGPCRMTSEVLAPNGPRGRLSAVNREGLGELGLLLGKAPCKGADPGRGSAAVPGAGLVALEELLLSPAPHSPPRSLGRRTPGRAEWESSSVAACWVGFSLENKNGSKPQPDDIWFILCMIYLTLAKSLPKDALTPATSLACPSALARARD